jgi:hypothetical protein
MYKNQSIKKPKAASKSKKSFFKKGGGPLFFDKDFDMSNELKEYYLTFLSKEDRQFAETHMVHKKKKSNSRSSQARKKKRDITPERKKQPSSIYE